MTLGSTDMANQGLRVQAAKPQGIIDRIFGWLMDIYNQEDNQWTVSLLPLCQNSQVLEIGFGTGLAIAEVAKVVTHGASNLVCNG